MKSLIDIIKSAFPGMYAAFEFAGTMFRRIYDSVLRTTINVITTATRQARDALTILLRVVNSAVTALFKVLNAMLQNITNILQHVSNMTDYMVIGLAMLFERFSGSINQVTLNTTSSQLSAIRQVEGNVNDIINRVYQNVSTALNPMLTRISNIHLEVYRMVSDLSKILERKIISTFQPMINYVQDLVYKLRSMSDQVTVVLDRTLNDTMITVYRVAVDTSDAMSGAVDKFEKEIESYVTKNINKVKHIATVVTRDLNGHILVGSWVGIALAAIAI